MEILDPNTRSCTFLTLTQYNDQPGSYIPAECTLTKDQAFLDSTNSWIAAESFRLSLAPSEYGAVYRYIPPEYFIVCEEESENQRADIIEEKMADDISFVDLQRSTAGSQSVVIVADEEKVNTCDIREISEKLLKWCNPLKLKDGSLVRGADVGGHTNGVELLYTLTSDTCPNIRSRGYGPQGLTPIYVSYFSSTDDDGNLSDNGQDTVFVNLAITKSRNPGLTLMDVKKYFSSGPVFLYSKDGAVVPEVGTQASFRIFGPRFLQTDRDAQTMVNNGNRSPVVQLYCTNQNEVYETGTSVQENFVDGNTIKSRTTKITSCPEWAFDEGVQFLVKLCGVPTVEGLTIYTNLGFPGQFAGIHSRNDYFSYLGTYKTGDALTVASTESIYREVRARVPCEIKTNADPPVPATPGNIAQVNTLVRLFRPKTRIRIKRQADETQTIPSYTPNDFMQYFNVGFKKEQSQPYVLTTDPNGGWRIVILSDNVSKFQISVQMCEEMGLDPVMINDGVQHTQNTRFERTPLVAQIYPDTTTPLSLRWFTSQNFDDEPSTQSMLQQFPLNEFSVINKANATVTRDLVSDDVPPLYLQHKTSGNYYKLICMNAQEVSVQNVSQTTHAPQLIEPVSEPPYYEWLRPIKGSYITNTEVVSIESFSIYEALNLIVPYGLAFEPQISSPSDARILTSLRLPFSNSAEVVQGFMDTKPLVLNTDSAFFGDLQWSATNFQYLPITTSGGIYDFEIAAELIARDPSVPPKRIQLGYTDIFQVKLRFINRN